jgi:hypothetical protein
MASIMPARVDFSRLCFFFLELDFDVWMDVNKPNVRGVRMGILEHMESGDSRSMLENENSLRNIYRNWVM